MIVIEKLDSRMVAPEDVAALLWITRAGHPAPLVDGGKVIWQWYGRFASLRLTVDTNAQDKWDALADAQAELIDFYAYMRQHGEAPVARAINEAGRVVFDGGQCRAAP